MEGKEVADSVLRNTDVLNGYIGSREPTIVILPLMDMSASHNFLHIVKQGLLPLCLLFFTYTLVNCAQNGPITSSALMCHADLNVDLQLHTINDETHG